MYNQDESTSKRISFQSILSSLCNLYQGGTYDFSQLEDMAYTINNRLHTAYPCEETRPMQNQPTISSGVKQKPNQCPKCGKMTLYHNKGKSRAGNPYENYKCKCGFIEWKTSNYYVDSEKAHLKSMRQDEDINQLGQEDYDARQQEVNSQYQGGY